MKKKISQDLRLRGGDFLDKLLEGIRTDIVNIRYSISHPYAVFGTDFVMYLSGVGTTEREYSVIEKGVYYG